MLSLNFVRVRNPASYLSERGIKKCGSGGGAVGNAGADRIQQQLALRPVVVCVEGCVVEVEEPQPVSPRHVRVATDRVILKQIYFI